MPKVAVVAGGLLLITRRLKPERFYREIDWSLLVMFIGLFIVIAGIEKTPARRATCSPPPAASTWNAPRR